MLEVDDSLEQQARQQCCHIRMRRDRLYRESNEHQVHEASKHGTIEARHDAWYVSLEARLESLMQEAQEAVEGHHDDQIEANDVKVALEGCQCRLVKDIITQHSQGTGRMN